MLSVAYIVEDRFPKLACLGDGNLHPVPTGELAWFLFLPSSARWKAVLNS